MAAMTPGRRLMALSAAVLGAFLCVTTTASPLLLPFSRRDIAPAISSVAISSAGYAYVVNATVGTPGQPLELVISTSTADSWVMSTDANMCQPDFYIGYRDRDPHIERSPCIWGTYNSSASTTYSDANSTRVSHRHAYEIWTDGKSFTDRLVLGDLEMEDHPIDLTTSSSQAVGVLGLGSNDAFGHLDAFMDRIVSSGKAITSAYSIWLDDPEGLSGNLLFGAIDESKYVGDLSRLKASRPNAYAGSFNVVIDRVNHSSSESIMSTLELTDLPVIVSINPAETLSYLPPSIVDDIMALSGATWNETLKRVVIDCEDAERDDSAKFFFELEGSWGPVLSVSLADLVVTQAAYMEKFEGASSWGELHEQDNTCLFGLQNGLPKGMAASTATYFILGSSFLRRSYLVFDVANHEIALAPVKYASAATSNPSRTSSIITFESYAAHVPSSKLYCATGSCEEDCKHEECDTPPLEAPDSETMTDPKYPAPTAAANVDTDPPYWQSIVIGVFSALGAVALILGLVFAALGIHKRRQRKRLAVVELSESSGSDSEPYIVMMSGGIGPHMARRVGLPAIQEEDADAEAAEEGRAPPKPLSLPAQCSRPSTRRGPVSAADCETEGGVSGFGEVENNLTELTETLSGEQAETLVLVDVKAPPIPKRAERGLWVSSFGPPKLLVPPIPPISPAQEAVTAVLTDAQTVTDGQADEADKTDLPDLSASLDAAEPESIAKSARTIE
ncbi:aspartic peptidase domain-containing protein [Lasiosphaeris hirsuta]|uniref:Aspartic peptidase domain-containing protein n=1 Tax=Lasiosphaeris hirsuta TaxID=260670 RepID=A0AA40DSM7_9PEZI|nr:aspartic peptidase domain-containing protein [Lasiosphaeris hirsuta]